MGVTLAVALELAAAYMVALSLTHLAGGVPRASVLA